MSRAVLIAAGLGLAALALPVTLKPAPALIWNESASAPMGLYLVHSPRTLRVGDWVAVWPAARFASIFAQRRYLPLGVPLVKRIAAVSPSVVCRSRARVTIDGRTAAVALSVDRRSRPLPRWRGCHPLRAGQVFVLNAAPDSLDSRYFGPISTAFIIGRLNPLWTSEGAGQ
jgi:conjugative transfer signal peptidase TraF